MTAEDPKQPAPEISGDLIVLAQAVLMGLHGPDADAFKDDLPEDVRKRPELLEHLLAFASFQRLQQKVLWGGRTPSVLRARQRRELRSALKRCSHELQALPRLTRLFLTVDVEDIVEGLELIEREVCAYRPGQITRSTVKADIEDRVAFLLSRYGVPLKKYRDGALAHTLRACYAYMKIRAGSDPKRVLKRLCDPGWVPDRDCETDCQLFQSILDARVSLWQLTPPGTPHRASVLGSAGPTSISPVKKGTD